MPTAFPPIIDADGHIFEDNNAIYALIPEPYKNERQVIGQSPFPQLDHIWKKWNRCLSWKGPWQHMAVNPIKSAGQAGG